VTVHNEEESLWSEADMVYFRIIFRNSPYGTEENPVSGVRVALEIWKISLPEHVRKVLHPETTNSASQDILSML
jgi:hypothetical protein